MVDNSNQTPKGAEHGFHRRLFLGPFSPLLSEFDPENMLVFLISQIIVHGSQVYSLGAPVQMT